MNLTERLALHWVFSFYKLDENDIKLNFGSSPDLICKNGMSFEIKTIFDKTVVIYDSQFDKLLKMDDCMIIGFYPKHTEPTVVIPVCKIDKTTRKWGNYNIRFKQYPTQKSKENRLIEKSQKVIEFLLDNNIDLSI
jgi:hypothetical protein